MIYGDVIVGSAALAANIQYDLIELTSVDFHEHLVSFELAQAFSSGD